MELNQQQTAELWAQWQQMGMRSGQLEEELFDHFCCLVEAHMEDGRSFAQAKSLAFGTFVPNELHQVQQEITKHKFIIMTQIPAMTFGLILAALGLIVFTFGEPPAGSPLPENFEVSSSFGWRMHPIKKVKKMHKGMDFRAPMGTPVMATADGEVVKAVKQKTGYGNMVIIKHDDTYKTLYGQLSEINVQHGQRVKKGQVIGKVGNSGASTGPHLHYEVIKDGEQINPEPFVKP